MMYYLFLILQVVLLTNNVCAQQQQSTNVNHSIVTLSEARSLLAAASSGELVFFGGGFNATGPSDRVDVYNVTSGNWTTATLSLPRGNLAATSSGNLVLFGGGANGTLYTTSTTFYNQVDIYNTSDGSWGTATLSQARAYFAATSVANLVLFGGGHCQGSTCFSNVVDIYNESTNNWANATLSVAREGLAATSTKNLAFFGGGYNDTFSNVVDVYNVSSGMWSTLSPLNVSRGGLTAVSFQDLIIFAGGSTSVECNTASNVVDVYNVTNSSHWTLSLSENSCHLASAALWSLIMIGGGGENGTFYQNVDVYDITNNSHFTVSLSQPRFNLAATSSTNKTFFGGGQNVSDGSQLSDIVDIFEIFFPSFLPSLPVPTSNASLSFITFPQSLPSNTLSASTYTTIPTASQQSTLSSSSSNFNTSSNAHNTISTTVLLAGVLGAVGVLSIAAIILLIVLLRKKRKNKKLRSDRNAVRLSMEAQKRGTVVLESATSTIIPDEVNATILETYQSATETLKSLTPGQIPSNELQIGGDIGQGTYGRVCVGKWNKYPVALKFCQNRGKMDEFMREANLMISLPPHPNVVRMYGVSIDGTQPIIVMEYCAGGSLDKILYDKENYISNEQKIRWIREIAIGMCHLHKHNIVHRDLAARNILLSQPFPNDAQLKISDFGMSRVLVQDIETKTKSGVGPVCWMAPESIGQHVYSKKSDVWMFGVLAYEIVARREPHADKNPAAVSTLIKDTGLTPPIPKECPVILCNLMEMCWQKEPEQRPSFEHIVAMFEQR